MAVLEFCLRDSDNQVLSQVKAYMLQSIALATNTTRWQASK